MNMELKDYLRVIKRERKIIILATLLCAAGATAGGLLTPVRYETSVSLFLNRQDTQATDQFKYDGYYALQAADLVADQLEKALQSPEIVNAVYEQSGLQPGFGNLKGYKKKFTAHKMSGQHVEIGFVSTSAIEAERLSGALTTVANRRLSEMSAASAGELSFSVSSNRPVTLEKHPDLGLIALLGAVSGLALGIFLSFLKKYLS